ncbi:hypothetical protein F5Y19DRAFT_475267 [Xylariaceae sp. FL1651]|nr:hypothetical protein F5Y19DRAFT_475267 [Xylariaceae sp. FL1651]
MALLNSTYNYHTHLVRHVIDREIEDGIVQFKISTRKRDYMPPGNCTYANCDDIAGRYKGFETIGIQFYVHATYAGYITCSFLQRRYISDAVRETADRLHPEGAFLELNVFMHDVLNGYGKMHTALIDDPIMRGAGIWGRELDTSNILVIERIQVETEFQRRGIAKAAILTAMETAQNRSIGEPLTAVARPLFMEDEVMEEVSEEWNAMSGQAQHAFLKEAEARPLKLFRELGFRRIGRSEFLGLSADNSHPCHTLAPEDDCSAAEEPEEEEEELEKEEEEESEEEEEISEEE